MTGGGIQRRRLAAGDHPRTAPHQPAAERTRGSMSIEAVIIIPAFLVFLSLIIAIARVAIAESDVHAAAVEGVRHALRQPHSSDGDHIAYQAASDHLAKEGITCLTLEITTETTALNLTPGQPGSLTATITCVVPLADLVVPGMPGQVTLTESFTTMINAYTGE